MELYKAVYSAPPPTTVSFYNMPAPPSVIICYTTVRRPTAITEADTLTEAFQHHKIEPKSFVDPTVEEMRWNIKKEADSIDTSALIVCIMMHGFEGFVECSDGHLPINDILELMNSESMGGKPKILVVQACRTEGPGNLTPGYYDLRGPDMLVLNASYAGGLAARNVMIPMFAKALKETEGAGDIHQILLPIANEMKREEPDQALVCYSSLRNRLLLSKV